jgi:hypothetical protein
MEPTDEPLREEGPQVPLLSPHQTGTDDGGAQDTPLDPPPSSLSGQCQTCKKAARAGFLCPKCGRLVPFPKYPGQTDHIPF